MNKIVRELNEQKLVIWNASSSHYNDSSNLSV
jgi:hypothetical protein